MAIKAAVYILASRHNGCLYIGVTRNLMKRIWHHRNVAAEGFSTPCTRHRLVYFEFLPNMGEALRREARLKTWRRPWTERIIREQNPDWMDLWDQVIQ